MGYNDEAEKLRQAAEWLKGPKGSEQYRAAWEHVCWILGSASSPSLKIQAEEIAAEVTRRHGSV